MVLERSPGSQVDRGTVVLADGSTADRYDIKVGDLRFCLDRDGLHDICLGPREMLRRVYFAFRDHNWNTLSPQFGPPQVDSSDAGVTVRFGVDFRVDGADFHADFQLDVRADHTMEYRFSGAADGDMRFCRIGFCVLHPISHLPIAVTATTPFGEVGGELSVLIGPQTIVDGVEVSLLPAFSRLATTDSAGSSLVLDFAGDLFEIEDQRNWADGSIKTYGTPIALGYPRLLPGGETISQVVRVRCEGAPPSAETHAAADASTTISRLPAIGFEVPRDVTYDESVVARLRALSPAHLRVEAHLCEDDVVGQLLRARDFARAIGAPLELAVFLDGPDAGAFGALIDVLVPADVARLVVFDEDDAAYRPTSPTWMELVRANLPAAFASVPVVGGTNGNFAEINRDRPETGKWDGLAFPINPQVHLCDDRNLIHSLDAMPHMLATARSFTGKPIHVSALTLKPPFNQAATEPGDPSLEASGLPAQVDIRQATTFAAGWTAAAIDALAGAQSITCYQTHGWRGIIGPDPRAWRGRPSRDSTQHLFPLYHLFAYLARFRGATVTQMPAPPGLRLVALSGNDRTRPSGLIAANLTPERFPWEPGIAGLGASHCRLLSPSAPFQPQRISDRNALVGGVLAPYEVALCDTPSAA